MIEVAGIVKSLTKAEAITVQSLPVVLGKRNGLFWASNDADLLADLMHKGFCKMPFADRWGQCDWQFVSRIKPLGLRVHSHLMEKSYG